ncbi:S41 family peptidase [Pseudoalteromonas denitrificans]|nr:S41 family peptidase [Pseudoalteromonas denitrificans]
MNNKLVLPLIVTNIFAGGCFVEAKPEFNSKAAWAELNTTVKSQYAYIDRANFDVIALIKEFELRALSAKNKKDFADIAQQFVRHFYDPHLNLGPYDENDFSVSPTGSDLWGLYQNEKFIIEDVKAQAAADSAGIRPGAEIITIDSLPVRAAVESVFGKSFEKLNTAQINYGLNVSLGGKRHKTRMLELKINNSTQSFNLAPSYQSINDLNNGPTLSYKKLNDIGYIRFNNALGNMKTVEAFKHALTELVDTKSLIIDLRNTPSGGNTGVAEPILGHFVKTKTPYQQYQVQEENTSYRNAQMQQAYVEPTKPHYNKPIVVLAGRWTGSMGEGMTIGFDAIGAKTVIGSEMADLLGGIKTVQLTHSNTWLEVGFERLFHMNNTYREDFVPHIKVTPADTGINGKDPALLMAQKYIKNNQHTWKF